jgi:rubrerythrin
MPFDEGTKNKVREKAAFRCCRCQEIGVEVHHIIPEEHGGPSTQDNAAPLCPNCHTFFGDNPKKRKEITHMRDWWYLKAEELFPNRNEMLDKINTSLQNMQANQTVAINELKGMLRNISDDMIDKMTPETAKITVSGILNTSVASSTKLASGVHANFSCSNCGTHIGLLIGGNSCPTCGKPIM